MTCTVNRGMMVRLTNNESSRVTEMVTPTSLSHTVRPSWAPRMMGANTTIEVRVAETTARATSRVPFSVAVTASSPCVIRRTMDSSTTTALSMSIPTPSISPIMESTFRLLPAMYM